MQLRRMRSKGNEALVGGIINTYYRILSMSVKEVKKESGGQICRGYLSEGDTD
jgi:hypothetical protein